MVSPLYAVHLGVGLETLWEVLAASWGSQVFDGYVEDSHCITK